ncbi:MAG: hypothetical protein GXY23_01485 [Myxococcales bacterium]|jgi:hypothetical protein|nr:hypothetical protein [Myxococcales bacterium]
MIELIPCPHDACFTRLEFELSPRPKRSFHTVLDAAKLLDPSDGRRSEVRLTRRDDGVVLETFHPIRGGAIAETYVASVTPRGLRSRSLVRRMLEGEREIRREEVDFESRLLDLPESTYPEVLMPFLLNALPFDGRKRSLHSWINDRFVARTYFEVAGRSTLEVGGLRVDAFEAILYPDLNDWVSLGAMATKIAKPLLPKYRMWYAVEAPHTLLRFEGPYGPPGAPEVVLTRAL